MHPRRIPLWLLTCCCCLLLVAAAHDWIMLPDGRTHLYVLDVGQGDALLVVGPTGRRALIDGGPDNSALEQVARHLPLLDRRIDIVVLSHPHADHLAALPAVIQRMQVGSVVAVGSSGNAAAYKQLYASIQRTGTPLLRADPATDIMLDDGLLLDVLWPPPSAINEELDANNASVVLRLRYGNTAALLTGDMELPAENALLATGENVRSTVLKVAHHGSRTSSSTGFLLAAKPSIGIISSGKDNSFGHPHADVLKRLHEHGVHTYVTAERGTVHVILDGTGAYVAGETTPFAQRPAPSYSLHEDSPSSGRPKQTILATAAQAALSHLRKAADLAHRHTAP